MRLMILEDRHLRTTVQATAGLVSIGSSPACGVHLPDPRISAHQASLTQDEDGAWWLEVVDPSALTCLNRAPQKGRAKLRHADEIEMGPFAIRLLMESSKTREDLQRERMQELSKRYGESLPLATIIRKAEHDVTVAKELVEQLTLLALRLEQAETVPDLMMPLLRFALRTFVARRAWVGIRRKPEGDFDWTLGLTAGGQPCDRPSYAQKVQDRCLAHTHYMCVPEAPLAGVRSVMAVPLPCQAGNLGFVYVENEPTDQPYDEASLNAISAMANCVSIPLENVLRKATAKQRATMTAEQALARACQDAATPKALPQWNDLVAAAYRHMGSGRCCDFYDVVQLRDKVASVIVARLNVAQPTVPRRFAELRTAFRMAALYSEAPHSFARALNWLVYEGEGQNAIDLACAWVNQESGKTEYCVAGQGVRLARIRPDGTCDALESETAPPVGHTRSPTFNARELVLESGDTLVFATDGVNTAVDAHGAVFGWEGLDESLGDGLGGAPGNVLSQLATDLTEFLEGGACRDDLTVVLVQRK